MLQEERALILREWKGLMAMHRVLVTDKLAEEGLANVSARSRASRSWSTPSLPRMPPALRQALEGADAIVIRSGTQLTAAILEGQPRLKAIVRAGVGVDNIDVAAATRRGIVVMNTPGGNTISTAEHTMALMLSLARNVPRANDSLKSGNWERNKFTGTPARRERRWEWSGLGRVGLAVAERARRVWNDGDRVRPVPLGREGACVRGGKRGAARRPVGPLRFRHAAHAAHRRDTQPGRRPRNRHDEADRADHQLCAGRVDR